MRIKKDKLIASNFDGFAFDAIKTIISKKQQPIVNQIGFFQSLHEDFKDMAYAPLRQFVVSKVYFKKLKDLQFKLSSELRDYEYINGADEYLLYLEKNGVPRALVIDTPNHCMEHLYKNENINAKAPLKKMFKNIVAGDDIIAIKPEPYGYLMAAEFMKQESKVPRSIYEIFSPSNNKNYVAFEDSYDGILAAARANMTVCRVHNPHISNSDLDQILSLNHLIDYEIEHFSEIVKS